MESKAYYEKVYGSYSSYLGPRGKQSYKKAPAKNIYKTEGEITTLTIIGEKQKREFKFNTHHLQKVKKYHWFINYRDDNYYAVTKLGECNSQSIKALQFILFDGKVSYKDGDCTNITDDNVLIGSSIKLNKKSSNNRTGMKGIYRNDTHYSVSLTYNHKTKTKSFNIKKMGEEAALQAAIKQREEWENEIRGV